METTLFIAVSANGFVARNNGNEDFLPEEGWIQMLIFARQFGHLILGRKTYEIINKWEVKYLNDLKDIPIIIVSKQNLSNYPQNVTVCASPKEAIIKIQNMGMKKAFLSGGPTLNSSFAKAGLIDKIILNYNPSIIAAGINIFNENSVDLNLKLEKIIKISPSIFQAQYLIK